MLVHENLIDVWKRINATSKEFTFYSSQQKSQSGIDLILMSNSLAFSTKKVEILPMIVASHNSVTCLGGNLKQRYSWRLNEDLLKSAPIVEYLKKEVKFYFALNLNKVPTQTVWDASKAGTRAILIKFSPPFFLVVSDSRQEAEIFLPRPAGLGRKHLRRALRTGKLQAPSGKAQRLSLVW